MSVRDSKGSARERMYDEETTGKRVGEEGKEKRRRRRRRVNSTGGEVKSLKQNLQGRLRVPGVPHPTGSGGPW